jgi:hypothetical protein
MIRRELSPDDEAVRPTLKGTAFFYQVSLHTVQYMEFHRDV